MEAEGLVAYIEDDEPNHSYEAHTHPNDEVLVAVLVRSRWVSATRSGCSGRRSARFTSEHAALGRDSINWARSAYWVQASETSPIQPGQTVRRQRAHVRKAGPVPDHRIIKGGWVLLTHPTRLPSSPEDLDIQWCINVLSYLYFSCILARNARFLRRRAGNQSRNRFPGLGDYNFSPPITRSRRRDRWGFASWTFTWIIISLVG